MRTYMDDDRWFVAAILAAFMAGCLLSACTTIHDAINPPPDDPVEDVAGDWAGIQWHGGGYAGAAETHALAANMNGSSSISYSGYSIGDWPKTTVGGVECQAIACIFFLRSDGRWEGGKYDWIRAGGQSKKGMENVHAGYNGLTPPASGTRVASAWVSINGKERTNLADAGTW